MYRNCHIAPPEERLYHFYINYLLNCKHVWQGDDTGVIHYVNMRLPLKEANYPLYDAPQSPLPLEGREDAVH